MKFPYLRQWDNATCEVFIQSSEPSENGDFPLYKVYEGRCNLSEKTNVIRGNDGEYNKLTCVLHIKGDIAPELPTFTGKVKINNATMTIESVDRPRNPDGSVHHTRLGLM